MTCDCMKELEIYGCCKNLKFMPHEQSDDGKCRNKINFQFALMNERILPEKSNFS